MKNCKALRTFLALTVITGMVLTGCGENPPADSQTTPESSPEGSTSVNNEEAEPSGSQEAEENTVEKPEEITIMVNGTFYTKANGQDEWLAKFEELTGIKLNIIQPDHSSYYDVLSQTLASGEWPDVVLLDSVYYSSYAAEGILWDMTEAWENSEVKTRLSESDQSTMDGMYLQGKLYGITRGRGNGTVTYIKKKWLDNVGLSVPTNYEEYLKVCEAFSKGDPDGNGVDGDTYAISAAGLIHTEAPYVQYLPEFYQDAFPSFYINEEGKWVDGFTEDSMKDALQRLRDAYENGILDPETLTNETSDARNKFFEDKVGIFTYWAGMWADRLRANLEAQELDSELVVLPPIAEIGQYIDRSTGGWAITSACENPEGVFKYFIESMFDGGEVQALWAYGVEGVHWSTAAEEVCGVTYQEGELHGLESRETPDTAYTFETEILLGITDEFMEKYPVVIPQKAWESQEIFNQNSRTMDRTVSTEEMTQYNGDLMNLKKEIIANVITQGKSIEEEYQRFESEGGAEWSRLIVDSLNNLN